MSEPWLQFYAAADVRELDRRAIEDHGIPGYTLMQRAAQAAWRQARRAWGLPDRLVVFCGPGNNGGDGYEIACLAAADGVSVDLRELPGERRGDAATARAAWQACGAISDDVAAPVAPPQRSGEGAYDESVWIVDALLGTGLSRAPEGQAAEAIAIINAARVDGARVLAVDTPSGRNADTGAAPGAAVAADLTVTFIGDKVGLHTSGGAAASGIVRCEPLGVPAAVYEGIAPRARRLDAASLRGYFPPRGRDAHKNRFGHVLIVGGAPGYAGAALLAGRAALRSGAGLVSVATHPEHAAALCAAQPELMLRSVEGPEDLAPLLERATVLALGPGLGTDGWGRSLFNALRDNALPRVLDADALNLLAEMPTAVPGAVLTPHPGEAARLLETSNTEIEADRIKTVRALAERYDATVVLKGAGSLIDDGSQPPWLCTDGNPGMACGGSGDVLTGVVAACLAQGLAPVDAAAAAVAAHAHAGDLAAAGGERGMVPGDLIDRLRAAVNPAVRGA
ncbi:bifunctional ADP-dependent NAD(P)H-hydrate dehydratase/NAD(P)H-hydrate epimerase [Algiphilus aromaticivorans]|uniref:bifunctional ADP-dependent NAD(P)H-hydrate dehydratase/NAD(P)H-hydrate epimerase n=1 Tax=Algiphilus aromaticivorans TaxID=382454 RepID=UPI0005C157CD|nr:bifunctional ADP-dependent NAD(P)H-hydrate dehydratase/NAD(P)H-hydrate epimerase [Algiphilus aromaticivorans]